MFNQVTVRHKGDTLTFNAPDNIDVLTSASDAGIDINYDCKIGNCHVCAVKVVSGELDQIQPNGEKFDASVTSHNYCLSCITFPRSDATLQTLDEDDRSTTAFTKYLDAIYNSWKKK